MRKNSKYVHMKVLGLRTFFICSFHRYMQQSLQEILIYHHYFNSPNSTSWSSVMIKIILGLRSFAFGSGIKGPAPDDPECECFLDPAEWCDRPFWWCPACWLKPWWWYLSWFAATCSDLFPSEVVKRFTVNTISVIASRVVRFRTILRIGPVAIKTI